MNCKSFQIGSFFLSLIIAGNLFFVSCSGDGNNETASSESSNQTAQTVEILKYSDFSCPACESFVPMEEQLKREFGDMVRITYKHFPLSGFQYSRLAAHAAEAAREQGKFDEMHDLIFENQAEWSRGNAREHFESYAEQLNLDMEQFRQDVESEEIAQRVENDRQEGMRRSVRSTPTFFVNGRKLQQNPQNYEQMKSIVELYMYRSN
ncbi:DsbA family protein [Rhodohalobacter sp. 8-1]|uniref:DsbA family protein n=1 Tax=Rhodohalobacter sp. 8-1 TaxID=3131972 RepID=UPI0030EF1D1B